MQKLLFGWCQCCFNDYEDIVEEEPSRTTFQLQLTAKREVILYLLSMWTNFSKQTYDGHGLHSIYYGFSTLEHAKSCSALMVKSIRDNLTFAYEKIEIAFYEVIEFSSIHAAEHYNMTFLNNSGEVQF